MTLAKLPSGRWRARVWHAGRDENVAAILDLPPGTTFATKREAKASMDRARARLRGSETAGVTVMEWWQTWTTDPLFARPKASTNRHNRERTRAFAEQHAALLIAQVDDQVVGRWLAGGQRNGTVPALRAMLNDASSAKGGRLLARNPFAGLGIARTRGNRDTSPPGEDTVRALITAARQQAGPSFAAWLQVAAYTGMRPGELDALRWDAVDLDRSRIHVLEQVSPAGGFTLPKNGRRRWAPLTAPARDALVGLARESEFCFTNLRGRHWTAGARAYHWNAIRARVGYQGTLYVATRHFAGSYMVNRLQLAAEDVAIALGHEDGGQLVRQLYGHRDRDESLDRVLDAYQGATNVVPLRAVKEA